VQLAESALEIVSNDYNALIPLINSFELLGRIHEDAIPNYNRQSPVRDAYLTVIDPKAGNKLWSDSHVWGGLLTGANSVGACLVKKLQSQMKK
jgi:hypothetical protein